MRDVADVLAQEEDTVRNGETKKKKKKKTKTKKKKTKRKKKKKSFEEATIRDSSHHGSRSNDEAVLTNLATMKISSALTKYTEKETLPPLESPHSISSFSPKPQWRRTSCPWRLFFASRTNVAPRSD